jgi:hypothetical protein
MPVIRVENKELLQTWYQLDSCAQPHSMDCGLLRAASQNLTFGTEFILSSRIEIIDGCEGLTVSLFLPFFTHSYE